MGRHILHDQASSSGQIVSQHIPCEECGSSDNRFLYPDGHSFCFSIDCPKPYYPSDNKKEFELGDFSYEYLPWRGVETNTFRTYDVRTKIGSDGKPIEIGFKYPNDSYKIRSIDGKDFRSVGDIGKAGLFGRNKFAAGSNKTVTITEGELDALSLYQVLHSPVVSVRSSGSAKLDCSLDRSWLNSFERIYLAFDGDGPGRDAAAGVAKLFDFNKVYNVRFPGGTRKDANDYVRAGEADELRTIWNNSKKYLPETVVSDLDTFGKILHETPVTGISWPWPTLNFMTYGIRPGETVLITAKEGVGKTEICHALEYQFLTQTDDAVGAIYIEEPKRRHLQAMAGIHLKTPVHLPDSGVGDDAVFTALKEVVRSDDRLHLYSHFGSDDPDVILDTIRFLVSARSCRYIILDHITMVVSGLGSESATKALDYLSTRLEMMVKELDFALILVSHVNDDGLTRGSRNISKVADIRVDLHRDLTAMDPVVRATTHVSVSKNRFSGRTGPAGDLLFNPVTYTLSEFGVEDEDNSIRDKELA